MPDWTKSMQQSFEYCEVDPGTWKDKRRIDNVISSSIIWDADSDTLGSASIDITDMVGEGYVRIYMNATQNGITEHIPLGTFLVQTPSSTFNGKRRSVTMDAYTPLIELKEKVIPLGYFIPKDENIMDYAYRLTRNYLRAPVVRAKSDEVLRDYFVANEDDNWATFLSDLIANAKYGFAIDELGQIMYSPVQDAASLQAKYTFNDDNSSILYSDITMDHDLYGIPNVIEVVYSTGHEYLYSRMVNRDPNSPVSTISRGREIIKRITDIQLPGLATQNQLDEYAANALKEASSIEYTISYTHAYCGVRLGDCVRLNYKRFGLEGIKAKVVSQSIKCVPGCPVEEKAVFTAQLWGSGVL